MLTTILIAAGAMAQAYGTSQPERAAPAAPAADAPRTASAAPSITTGRALKDLPGTTVTYYDIPGRTGPAIEKSLKKVLADPASKDVVRLMKWDVDTQIVKRITGTKCTIHTAKSTFTAEVRLPRLAEQAKVAPNVLAKWNAYAANIENETATNLWFVSDRLRGAEQSLVGISCDQAGPVWNAKVDGVKAQLQEFMAQRAQPSPTPGSSGLQPVQVPDRPN